jgi:DNA repair exonuclease SbcCD ATPase subunit
MDLNEHKRLVDEELARKIKQNDDTIAQMLEDAEQLKQSILDDKDGELLQRQGELDDLNKEVAKQKKLIADLQQEWETVIVPKQKDLKDIIDVANKYIEYHYSKAEKSKGKLQDYHYDRVNFLWDIKDKATAFLNKLLK